MTLYLIINIFPYFKPLLHPIVRARVCVCVCVCGCVCVCVCVLVTEKNSPTLQGTLKLRLYNRISRSQTLRNEN